MMRVLAVVCAAGITGTAGPRTYVNAQLPWHSVKLDSANRLLAWHQPDNNLGWDEVLRIGWNFLERKVPKDTTFGTGLKVYLVNSVYDGESLQGTYWQHNPAMVFAALVDGLVAWYPYSDDKAAIAVVREMLDHSTAYGSTPADWDWAGVPFATSCGKTSSYGTCMQNLPPSFYGGIETDKVGELGTGYVLFYELTGERKYLDAGIRCATALARHVRLGDADKTPWPFRLDARTGETLAREEYGGNIAGSLRLFDILIDLKQGDTGAFQKARQTALERLKNQPLNRESPVWYKWTGYFEDVSRNTDNYNQVLPTLLARYVLMTPEPESVTPRWTKWNMMTGQLLDWVRTKFGRGPYFGAWAIDEQGTSDGHGCCSRAGLGSYTSRWAAINALYYERTGDAQAREDSFRSLNYATYFAQSDGRISCCGEGFGSQFWFSDGYADYLRHFSWAMGSMPEFAPKRQDHLLRSTSVVQQVHYESRALQYRTFHSKSTEDLRLSYLPDEITAGGKPLSRAKELTAESYTIEPVDENDYIVHIRHDNSGEVHLRGK